MEIIMYVWKIFFRYATPEGLTVGYSFCSMLISPKSLVHAMGDEARYGDIKSEL
jgi:hypothetical protein